MEIKQVLVAAVEIGECLLVSGGGVSRVEDTIGRICRAYGARETDVFSITSSIVASVRDEDGEVYTRTKRIREYHTDFYKLDQLNQLSRYICENQDRNFYGKIPGKDLNGSGRGTDRPL